MIRSRLAAIFQFWCMAAATPLHTNLGVWNVQHPIHFDWRLDRHHLGRTTTLDRSIWPNTHPRIPISLNSTATFALSLHLVFAPASFPVRFPFALPLPSILPLLRFVPQSTPNPFASWIKSRLLPRDFEPSGHEYLLDTLLLRICEVCPSPAFTICYITIVLTFWALP